MKSHYETLGIEQNADQKQIKQAYFKLVRQYSPEHHPEEFKQIRSAYETLSNEKSRAEYDKGNNLPPEIKSIFMQVRRAAQRGQLKMAAKTMLILIKVYPDLPLLKAELANIYHAMGHTGKAIKLLEQLLQQEPQNAVYSLKLANAYYDRTWAKKAAAQYERTTELDPYCVEAWEEWLDICDDRFDFDTAERICNTALGILQEKNILSIRLCHYYYMIVLIKQSENANTEYIHEALKVLKTGKNYPPEEIERLVSTLLNFVGIKEEYSLIPYLKEIAGFLPEIDEELLEKFAHLERIGEIKALDDQGFPSMFSDLLDAVLDNSGSEHRTNAILAMECYFLADADEYRPHIIRLKNEYPGLFEIHASFFTTVLITRNPEEQLQRRLKSLAKKGLVPNFIPSEDNEETEAPQETIRREGPKIGRNDPCPCGSSKKYKKCCGS